MSTGVHGDTATGPRRSSELSLMLGHGGTGMINKIAGLLFAFAGMLLPTRPWAHSLRNVSTKELRRRSVTCPSLLFSVDETTVTIDADTTFEGGACADSQQGTLIEVEGARPSDGRVVATEVEFESDDTDRNDDSTNDDEDGAVALADGRDHYGICPPLSSSNQSWTSTTWVRRLPLLQLEV
jgi:hypothetical protein